MNIELVIWRDAHTDNESWISSQDLEDYDHLVHSVGFVVKETDKNLTLAMDLDGAGQTNGRGRIPKSLIVSREVLYEQDKD